MPRIQLQLFLMSSRSTLYSIHPKKSRSIISFHTVRHHYSINRTYFQVLLQRMLTRYSAFFLTPFSVFRALLPSDEKTTGYVEDQGQKVSHNHERPCEGNENVATLSMTPVRSETRMTISVEMLFFAISFWYTMIAASMATMDCIMLSARYNSRLGGMGIIGIRKRPTITPINKLIPHAIPPIIAAFPILLSI